MFNYISKRLLIGLISLFLAIVIIFFLMGLNQASPISRSDFTGPNAEADFQQKIEDSGLNKSIVLRFFDYITGIFHGDFGLIYNSQDMGSNSITEIFFSPLKYSIIVTSISFLSGAIIGTALGVWAGYKNGKMSDIVINFIVIGFSSLPGFVLSALFIVLAPYLQLPSSFLDWNTYGYTSAIFSMILPIIVLTMLSISTITYFIRNEIKNILDSDYVTNARSKGLSEFSIFKNYVFRNASIPWLSIVLPGFLRLLAGSFIIEQFFGVPGSSTVLISAIKNNETNVVMFQLLFFGFLSFLMTILLDVMYLFIDPRIKYSSATEIKKFGIIPWFQRKWIYHKKNQKLLKKGGK